MIDCGPTTACSGRASRTADAWTTAAAEAAMAASQIECSRFSVVGILLEERNALP